MLCRIEESAMPEIFLLGNDSDKSSKFHVPQHQDLVQFRAARNGRGDPRFGFAIRPQAERLSPALEVNEAAFNIAIEQVARAAHELLDALVSNAPPRDRKIEAAKARARNADRFR
jgi:hypothetical protein